MASDNNEIKKITHPSGAVFTVLHHEKDQSAVFSIELKVKSPVSFADERTIFNTLAKSNLALQKLRMTQELRDFDDTYQAWQEKELADTPDQADYINRTISDIQTLPAAEKSHAEKELLKSKPVKPAQKGRGYIHDRKEGDLIMPQEDVSGVSVYRTNDMVRISFRLKVPEAYEKDFPKRVDEACVRCHEDISLALAEAGKTDAVYRYVQPGSKFTILSR